MLSLRERDRPGFGYHLKVHSFRTFTVLLAWGLIFAAFYQKPELLTGAQRLMQRGIEAAVYERAPALGEVGAGIQLGPNAVKVLRALGLESSLRRVAAEPANYVSLAWDDAHLRYREPMKGPYAERYGAPYLMAHRADLHRLLCGLVADETVELGAHCIGGHPGVLSDVFAVRLLPDRPHERCVEVPVE